LFKIPLRVFEVIWKANKNLRKLHILSTIFNQFPIYIIYTQQLILPAKNWYAQNKISCRFKTRKSFSSKSKINYNLYVYKLI